VLRIRRTEANGVSTTYLEGKLLGPWLDEFKAVLPEGIALSAVRVDLEGVTYLDAAGAELLLELRRRGVQIVGGSPFVLQLLDRPPT
jgi:ABC-type transporter Mla MlaB component